MTDKQQTNLDISDSFLNEVTDQIAYKPIRLSIRQELEEHLLDRMEDYESQGISSEDAMKKAVQEMGDAVRIGVELNEVHSVRSISFPQIVVSCLFMLVGAPSVRYCMMLFSTSLIVTGIYYIQNKMNAKQYIGMILSLLLSIGLICASQYVTLTAKVIFGLSLFGTLFFMIDRGIISGKKIRLYLVTVCGALVFSVAIITDQNHDMWLKTFLEPENAVQSTWDDAYNGSLIQELLSETPWIGGLELSQEELLDYETGAWYFAERDEKQIGIIIPQNETEKEQQARKEHVQKLREEGVLPKYIYKSSEIELWDVLPQHYQNNYIFAAAMFMFGRLPGMMLVLMAVGLLYLLARCVHRIQGRLAASLSYCYLQCLVWQSVFYILGNFGFQYGSFPNMPMLSEGRISIFLNMFMIGMILSAYRYDHVVEEKDTRRTWSLNRKPVNEKV